jgi:hypothetical protein
LNIPPTAIELIPPSELSVPFEDIDFTKPYLSALPYEIWYLFEDMKHEAIALLRDSTDPTLTAEEAAHIESLPPLPPDVANEVRRTMKKVWRKVYKLNASLKQPSSLGK